MNFDENDLAKEYQDFHIAAYSNSEIVGIFNKSDKATRKQLLTTLSLLDIANINKYKEKLE